MYRGCSLLGHLSNIEGIPCHTLDPVCFNHWSHSFTPHESSLQNNWRTHEKLKYGYCFSFEGNSTPRRIFEELNWVEDEDFLGHKCASGVVAFVNGTLRASENTVSRSIRLELMDLYGNRMPSYQVEDVLMPNGSAVSALLELLFKFHVLFPDNLSYDFTFAVSEHTGHVWTNVKVMFPPDWTKDRDWARKFKFLTNSTMINSLSSCKVGLSVDGLRASR
ncbi:hypothetical protein GYMLUDRAFT_68256 [Collybiopsis luxurians FD-317 M1]|nr:hypothetical protein GYMLUDRAFT_68256 [Collybiopsis luxurians FD-317 M1]